MASYYLKCDGCEAMVDRYPKEIAPHDGSRYGGGTFSSDDARSYAKLLGWRIGKNIHNDQDYCSECIRKIYNDPSSLAEIRFRWSDNMIAIVEKFKRYGKPFFIEESDTNKFLKRHLDDTIVFVVDNEKCDAICQWVVDNIPKQDDYEMLNPIDMKNHNLIYLRNSEDAIHFKLRWL